MAPSGSEWLRVAPLYPTFHSDTKSIWWGACVNKHSTASISCFAAQTHIWCSNCASPKSSSWLHDASMQKPPLPTFRVQNGQVSRTGSAAPIFTDKLNPSTQSCSTNTWYFPRPMNKDHIDSALCFATLISSTIATQIGKPADVIFRIEKDVCIPDFRVVESGLCAKCQLKNFSRGLA